MNCPRCGLGNGDGNCGICAQWTDSKAKRSRAATFTLEDEIINLIARHRLTPIELIQSICPPDRNEAAVKAVLARLVNAGDIRLTPNRHIVLLRGTVTATE